MRQARRRPARRTPRPPRIDIEQARSQARELAAALPERPARGIPAAPARSVEQQIAAALAPRERVERREGGQWVMYQGNLRCVLSNGQRSPALQDMPEVQKCSVVTR